MTTPTKARPRRAWTACLWLPFWLCSLAGALAQQQVPVPPPLQPDEMYNIYVVDLSAVEHRTDAVARYIAYRWRRFLGADTGVQNGWIYVRDGRLGGYKNHTSLSQNDQDQFEKIKKFIDSEQQRRIPINPFAKPYKPNPGLNLAPSDIGGRIADEVRHGATRAAITDLNRQGVRARRLITIHLITDEIWFQQDDSGPARNLMQVQYPDQCVMREQGIGRLDSMADALAAFPDQVRTAVGASSLIAGAAALVLVRPGDGRFADATERAAAIAVLGTPTLTGRRAVAMRDRLDPCGIADPEIHVTPASNAACTAGERLTETRPPYQCTNDQAPSRQALVMDLLRPSAVSPDASQAPPATGSPSSSTATPTTVAPPASLAPDTVAAPRAGPVPDPVAPPRAPSVETKAVVPPPPPEPGRPQPVRVAAIAKRWDAGATGSGFPGAKAAGVEVVMIRMPPAPQTEIAVFDGGGAASRAAPGPYRLVARTSPETRCDGQGHLAFGITFTVPGAAPESQGRWEVTLPDGCRGAAETTFATVTIQE